jgi:hypothetical protein
MNDASQRTAGGWTVGRLDTRIGWMLGFAAILAFYLATTPANRFEAFDGYAYAYDAEARSLTDLYDTRLLLFHVVMRLLYRAAHAIHDGVSAHSVLLMVSALSASLCLVLFARLLNRHLGLSLPASLLGAGLLGATYGFWRYSVEAEVYAPSLFLLTAVLTLVFAAEDRADGAGRWTTIAPAGVLAGLAVLFYQPNAIPLFLALPVVFLRRGGLPRLIAYGAAGGAVILLGYVIGFLVDEARPLTAEGLYTFVFKRFDEFPLDEGVLSTIAKSIAALGHDIASANWVFGLEIAAAAKGIEQYEERVFAAAEAGDLLLYLPPLTMAALVVVGVYTTSIALQGRRRNARLDRRLAFVLSWFMLYVLVNGRLAPGSYEVWIMTLPALIILFAAIVVEPCIRNGRRIAPILLLVTLVLHNAIGGIGILSGGAGDYYRAKGAWVLGHATTDDLIMLPVNEGFGSFLCYVGGLRVVTLSTREGCLRHEQRNVSELIETTQRNSGRIFVFDEFLDPPASWNVSHRSDPEALALAERFRGTEQLVFRSDAGTTYRLP